MLGTQLKLLTNLNLTITGLLTFSQDLTQAQTPGPGHLVSIAHWQLEIQYSHCSFCFSLKDFQICRDLILEKTLWTQGKLNGGFKTKYLHLKNFLAMLCDFWELSCLQQQQQCQSLSCVSLRPHKLWPVRLLYPWDSPGENTGVDCRSLLQRIFLIQGSNPGLLHYRQILYHLSYREDQDSSLTRERTRAVKV